MNCLARGYDRTGFFEVDTGEQRSWTVQLTDTADADAGPAVVAESAALALPRRRDAPPAATQGHKQ